VRSPPLADRLDSSVESRLGVPWIVMRRRLGALVRHRQLWVLRGPARGLRFNPSGTKAGYLLGRDEPEVQRCFAEALKSGDVVYDVGAAAGFFTVLAARLVGDGGRVYAFEPLPRHAEAVRQNARINDFTNVAVIEAACGRVPGRDILLVPEDDSTQTGSHRPSGEPLDVEVVAIDDLGLPPPQLVKIDVEGAEVDVLHGLINTLERSRPLIVCELHGTNDHTAQLLQGLHYKLELFDSRSVARAPWGTPALARPE
jgi:FkbM family methyltransferase